MASYAETGQVWFAVNPNERDREVLDLTKSVPPDFDSDNFIFEIIPLGKVAMFPVEPLNGHDLVTETQLQGAFGLDYLFLRLPQPQQGDTFIMRMTDGVGEKKRTFNTAVQYNGDQWNFIAYNSNSSIVIKKGNVF